MGKRDIGEQLCVVADADMRRNVQGHIYWSLACHWIRQHVVSCWNSILIGSGIVSFSSSPQNPTNRNRHPHHQQQPQWQQRTFKNSGNPHAAVSTALPVPDPRSTKTSSFWGLTKSRIDKKSGTST